MIVTNSTGRRRNRRLFATAITALLVCAPVFSAAAEDAADPEEAQPVALRTKDDCKRWMSAAAQGEGAGETTSWPKMEETLENLVTCGAIAQNSAASCQTLEGHAAADCSIVVSTFEELERNPDGRSFVFPDASYAQCTSDSELSPFCDGIREAANANDPSKCPSGMLEKFCQALVSLDRSVCKQIVEPAGANKECEHQVAKLAPYAAGLKKLATSGPQPLRTFANAALGEKNACAALAEKATGACLASVREPEDPPEPGTTGEGMEDEDSADGPDGEPSHEGGGDEGGGDKGGEHSVTL